MCSSMKMELAMVKSEEENNELVAEASRTLGSPYLDRNFENVNQVPLDDVFIALMCLSLSDLFCAAV